MPVVKGGVWTNIEDEILKASVSKYGLNQWARVSSLLARKTPKQCKARWTEWLDPSIRKIEWSKEEDEKLLHLAKLMPTQWRTIAPIVGRTATQCLDRYQKLLDEAETREQREMGLMGPDGGETQAPSADDVRRLRPGELDPDPESKPAKPDTIDLDEDQKEMLSEARARLANTQGKKAKRKARERQLEESRRLALLQKRRELKNAGINIKIVNRKKGQMDYDTDIPFEKAPAPGFYDTREEEERNEKQREAFDPRKQQLANKRKGDQDDMDDRKKRKNDKGSSSKASAAATAAGQMQKIREAEQSSKRRSLVLPAPQVGEGELENIIKMGLSGERASQIAGSNENEATRGLIGNYSNIAGSTPIRTPRAPQEEDRVANEIRNARARTETSSALLGGENTPLYEGSSSTGFQGVTPINRQIQTPNPLATPLRQGGSGAIAATPGRDAVQPGATPLRTPRDNFHLNDGLTGSHVGQTPRDLRMAEQASRNSLRGKLSSLPKPKETDWELELPDEQDEPVQAEGTEEDAAERDRREQLIREAADQAEFRRQSQVLQKGLPRPPLDCIEKLQREATGFDNRVENMIVNEMIALMKNDASRLGSRAAKPKQRQASLETFSNEDLERARMEIALEISIGGTGKSQEEMDKYWDSIDEAQETGDDDIPRMAEEFEKIQQRILDKAQRGNDIEKRLSRLLGGYQQRAKMLRQKITNTADEIAKLKVQAGVAYVAQAAEEAETASRLEKLREEVSFISRRERQAQELYRARKDELDGLGSMVNGSH